MKTSDKNTLLAQFASKVSSDDFFLSELLGEYQESYQLSNDDLCDLLKCSSDNLSRLKSCKTPILKSVSYYNDIEKIAGYVKCDSQNLLRIIQEVSVIRSMRDKNSVSKSTDMLLAARDNKQSDPDE